ncbi:MAG: type II CAAX endopeptidase family protein [Candidatus Paceibacterota bacterium]
MDNIPSKKIIWAQILLIFVLPIFLLYFKIVPSNWRIILLVLSSLFIYGIIRHEHWSYEEMGIRHDNIKRALPFYLLLIVIGLLSLFIIDSKINLPDIDTKIFFIKTFIFFLPISFFQEFIFRSFLIPRLRKLFNNNYSIIFLNTILFVFMHIIYSNWIIILPLLFVSGILFAWIYLKHPNLILISITHSVLNLTAMLLGFFILS